MNSKNLTDAGDSNMNKKLVFTIYGAGLLGTLCNISSGILSPTWGGMVLAIGIIGYVLEFYYLGD